MLNGPNSGIRFRKGDIRKQLQEKFGLVARLSRWQHPNEPDASGLKKRTDEKIGRCYEFRIENFLTEQEIKDELSEFIDFDKDIKNRPAITPAAKAEDLPF
jgi:hypothetical protein